MAEQRLKRDPNFQPVMGAVTNDASAFVQPLLVDPVTGRLLVDPGTISVSASSASVGTTGSAVPTSADFIGAQDGSGNLQGLKQIVNATNSTGTGILAVGNVAQFDDVAPTAITENQFGNLRMSANRNLYVQLRDNAGNERGLNIDASGQIAVTVSGTVTVDTELPAAAAAADGATNPTAPFVNAANSVFNGTTWDRVKEAANALNSTGTGIPTAQIVGQFDDVSPTAITENQFGNIRMSANRNLYGTLRDAAGNERGLNISSRNAALVEGGTASGSSIAAAPVTIGGRAASANPTAVTDGQVVNTLHDLKGRIVGNLGQVRELRGKQTTTISASTSETTIATAVASTFLDLIALIISNTSASTNTRVDIRDTTSGTVLFSLQSPGNSVIGFSLPGASIPQTTVNTNWTAQCGTSTTDLRVLAVFEKNT